MLISIEFITKWGLRFGLAGVAFGVLLLIFRRAVSRSILQKLKPNHAFIVVILVAFFIWLLAAYCASEYFHNSKTGDTVVVFVHGPNGTDDPVLPGRGEVTLIYGTAFVTRTTNKDGDANFEEVPQSFFDPEASVKILFSDPLGEKYHALNPDSIYKLTRGKYISLTAKLIGLDSIWGIVTDARSEQPIDSVEIRIFGIKPVFSNKYGEYILHIPAGMQKKYQIVMAYKNRYERFEQNVPIETESELPIQLKRSANK